MYTGASNFVEGVDWVFKLIFGISIFFLFLITALMIYFSFRYSRKRHPKPLQIKDNIGLEIIWITIPTILVLLMFYFGYSAFQPMIWVPKDSMKVKVIGRMWEWSFEYPNGRLAKELFLPINKPVKLNLHSVDVIHGFSIPDFRVKEDVVPGKDNYMWFRPQKIGVFEIFCSAYCGVRHSFMGSKVHVVTEEEFTRWLSTLPLASEEPEGLKILKKNACTGCHSIDGSKLVSSTFKGIFGKKGTVTTSGKQQKITVDETYLTTSVFNPDLNVVTGYQKGIMKSYKGLISEEEMKKIIAYLKTLK
jgi:cytochrome c oxidase subunit II